jgi:hypothetical protein
MRRIRIVAQDQKIAARKARPAGQVRLKFARQQLDQRVVAGEERVGEGRAGDAEQHAPPAVLRRCRRQRGHRTSPCRIARC